MYFKVDLKKKQFGGVKSVYGQEKEKKLEKA